MHLGFSPLHRHTFILHMCACLLSIAWLLLPRKNKYRGREGRGKKSIKMFPIFFICYFFFCRSSDLDESICSSKTLKHHDLPVSHLLHIFLFPPLKCPNAQTYKRLSNSVTQKALQKTDSIFTTHLKSSFPTVTNQTSNTE